MVALSFKCFRRCLLAICRDALESERKRESEVWLKKSIAKDVKGNDGPEGKCVAWVKCKLTAHGKERRRRKGQHIPQEVEVRNARTHTHAPFANTSEQWVPRLSGKLG